MDDKSKTKTFIAFFNLIFGPRFENRPRHAQLTKKYRIKDLDEMSLQAATENVGQFVVSAVPPERKLSWPSGFVLYRQEEEIWFYLADRRDFLSREKVGELAENGQNFDCDNRIFSNYREEGEVLKVLLVANPDAVGFLFRGEGAGHLFPIGERDFVVERTTGKLVPQESPVLTPTRAARRIIEVLNRIRNAFS